MQPPAFLRRAFARRVVALATGAAAVVTAAAIAACSSDQLTPTAPAAGPTAAAPFHDATGGGTSTAQVQVPASMRSAPFDVARTLTVPAGYGVAVYARVGGARFMAAAPNGDLLVSNPGAGAIYRVRPSATGGDPAVTTWASGLNQPHDIVFHAIGGTMYVYVSETNRIGRYTWDAAGATAQNRQVLITGLPSVSDTALHGAYAHQLKNIALGPDDKLYVSIASSCNACTGDVTSAPVRGAIYVYNSDGTNGRLFARGIRNAEGLAFVPGTNTLWATVNNRDNTAYPYHRDYDGDGTDDYGKVMQAYVNDHPTDEFIRVGDGANFGWPFCNPNPDGGVDNMPFDRDVQLNADGSQLDCSTATVVNKGIPAHSAALGLTFLVGTKAPAALQGGVAVALHGSWNRSPATGAKVVWFPWSGAGAAGAPGAQQDLVSGWLANGSYWGRPVDFAVDSTGNMFVSDDQSGTIYRLIPGAASSPAAVAARGAGTCLDLNGGSSANGTRALMWSCYGGFNQQWRLPAVGTVGPITHANGNCLDALQGGTGNGEIVGAWACNGGTHQQWTVTGAGQIQDAATGLCLDVDSGSRANGAKVQLWTCTPGNTNQLWNQR